jgi:hypothetical protein
VRARKSRRLRTRRRTWLRMLIVESQAANEEYLRTSWAVPLTSRRMRHGQRSQPRDTQTATLKPRVGLACAQALSVQLFPPAGREDNLGRQEAEGMPCHLPSHLARHFRKLPSSRHAFLAVCRAEGGPHPNIRHIWHPYTGRFYVDVL